MPNKLLHTHRFVFNGYDNGGEHLTLVTKYFDNGDPDGVYVNQTITLNSYCNSASFDLIGASLSSDLLRKLADELDSAMILARSSKNVVSAV